MARAFVCPSGRQESASRNGTEPESSLARRRHCRESRWSLFSPFALLTPFRIAAAPPLPPTQSPSSPSSPSLARFNPPSLHRLVISASIPSPSSLSPPLPVNTSALSPRIVRSSFARSVASASSFEKATLLSLARLEVPPGIDRMTSLVCEGRQIGSCRLSLTLLAVAAESAEDGQLTLDVQLAHDGVTAPLCRRRSSQVCLLAGSVSRKSTWREHRLCRTKAQDAVLTRAQTASQLSSPRLGVHPGARLSPFLLRPLRPRSFEAMETFLDAS